MKRQIVPTRMHTDTLERKFVYIIWLYYTQHISNIYTNSRLFYIVHLICVNIAERACANNSKYMYPWHCDINT